MKRPRRSEKDQLPAPPASGANISLARRCLPGSHELVQLGAQVSHFALSPLVGFQFVLREIVEFSADDGFHLLLEQFAEPTRDGIERSSVHRTQLSP